ncbi:hypothetical protein D3C83_302600 [compost metagenome]
MLYLGRVCIGGSGSNEKLDIQWDETGWQVGDKLPEDIKSAVMVFQADGDELDIIIEALSRK